MYKHILKTMHKKVTLMLAAAMLALTANAQQTKYVKVEAEPENWCGEYLIVYEADDENNVAYAFNGALEDLDVVSNFIEVSNPAQDIDGATIRAIDPTEAIDAATFTVTNSAEAGFYYIQSKSGYWIGYNSTKAGEDGVNPDPDMKTSNEKQYDNSIALESGKTSVNVIAKNGFALRFNADAGKTRFRYHQAGKKKSIKFYKKTTSETAIRTLNAAERATKTYDLMGRKSTTSPILISGGKKVIK